MLDFSTLAKASTGIVSGAEKLLMDSTKTIGNVVEGTGNFAKNAAKGTAHGIEATGDFANKTVKGVAGGIKSGVDLITGLPKMAGDAVKGTGHFLADGAKKTGEAVKNTAKTGADYLFGQKDNTVGNIMKLTPFGMIGAVAKELNSDGKKRAEEQHHAQSELEKGGSDIKGVTGVSASDVKAGGSMSKDAYDQKASSNLATTVSKSQELQNQNQNTSQADNSNDLQA